MLKEIPVRDMKIFGAYLESCKTFYDGTFGTKHL